MRSCGCASRSTARVTVTIVPESQVNARTFASRPVSLRNLGAGCAGDGRPGGRLGVHSSGGEREGRLRRASRRALRRSGRARARAVHAAGSRRTGAGVHCDQCQSRGRVGPHSLMAAPEAVRHRWRSRCGRIVSARSADDRAARRRDRPRPAVRAARAHRRRPRHARVRRVDRARAGARRGLGGRASSPSAGVMPTPGVAYLAGALEFDLGVVLSASHNPYADNGIKVFSGRGEKFGEARGARRRGRDGRRARGR